MSLTEDQKEHKESLITDFIARLEYKYEAGAKEHGGNLWDKDLRWLIENLENELVDAWAYLGTIKEKLDELERAGKILRED